MNFEISQQYTLQNGARRSYRQHIEDIYDTISMKDDDSDDDHDAGGDNEFGGTASIRKPNKLSTFLRNGTDHNSNLSREEVGQNTCLFRAFKFKARVKWSPKFKNCVDKM